MPRKPLARSGAVVSSTAGQVKECVRVAVPRSGSPSGPASVPVRPALHVGMHGSLRSTYFQSDITAIARHVGLGLRTVLGSEHFQAALQGAQRGLVLAAIL